MAMNRPELLVWLTFIVPFFLSLGVHTAARIWTTCCLRDSTNTGQRRFSSNPYSYVDWIGTLLLPLFGVPFGWTKASWVNPFRFRFSMSMQTGRLLIALAGPLSNLLLAILGAFAITLLTSDFRIPIAHLVLINLSLALFHMLPVPPLAGYHIVNIITAGCLSSVWIRCRVFSPIALACFFIILPRLAELRLFDWPITATYSLLSTISSWLGS